MPLLYHNNHKQFITIGRIIVTRHIANTAITEAKQIIKASYSSSETDTGAKWVDGKTIYKKTVNTGALPNATSKSVPHGITNLDNLIRLEGWSKRTLGSVQYYSDTLAFSPAIMTTRYVTPTDIVIGATDNRSDFTSSYTTLYYTKS